MPANLTPQYYDAEEKYKSAATTEEKMAALKEMLSMIPKHKGTEKLQGDIKKRMAVLRKESQKKKTKNTFNPFNIEKQGAGQVVLAGHPNVGKSTLLSNLTRAKAKVAEYPFSTTLPLAGMMPYKDIMIQLVDTPPIAEDATPAGLVGTLQKADMLIIMIDASSGECLEQLDDSFQFLAGKKLLTKPYLILANKYHLPGSRDNIEVVKELNPDTDLLLFSSSDEDIEKLKNLIFNMLGVIRVYSKTPGKPADMDKPFTLKKGSNVMDFAYAIHRDFPEQLKNALVWGSAKFDGQAVAKDYVLADGDVVEIQV